MNFVNHLNQNAVALQKLLNLEDSIIHQNKICAVIMASLYLNRAIKIVDHHLDNGLFIMQAVIRQVFSAYY